VAHRWFLRDAARRPELFRDVPLYFAPDVRLDLEPTDVGHGLIALTGFYELALTRRLTALARAGGLLVDVGANYGYFSCLWAATRSDNRVLALEASPRNVAPLRGNLARNGFAARVEVLELAAGHIDGPVTLAPGPDDQTGWGGIVTQPSESTVTVPGVRLDTLLGPERIVDFLKIDVEGADTWVLHGADRLLSEHRVRHLCFEHNRTRMAQLGIGERDAAEWLRDRGYRVEQMARDEWYATPES